MSSCATFNIKSENGKEYFGETFMDGNSENCIKTIKEWYEDNSKLSLAEVAYNNSQDSQWIQNINNEINLEQPDFSMNFIIIDDRVCLKNTQKDYEFSFKLSEVFKDENTTNCIVNFFDNMRYSESSAIFTACEFGHTETLKLLLNDYKPNAKVDFKNAIELATINGHADVISVLLKDITSSKEIPNSNEIKKQFKEGYSHVVKAILGDDFVENQKAINEALTLSITNNKSSVLKMLLKDKNIDINTNSNFALKYSSEKGYIDLVELLINDNRINPSIENNSALLKSINNNHLETTKLLLSDKRVDPSNCRNEAILTAVHKGNVEMVELLLSDKRVDPSDYGNKAILIAVEQVNVEMVELLLNDKRVDPTVDHNTPLLEAKKQKEIMNSMVWKNTYYSDEKKIKETKKIEDRYLKVDTLLRNDPRVNQSDLEADIFLSLVKENDTKKINQFLKESKLTSFSSSNIIIKNVVHNRRGALLLKLIKDGRFDFEGEVPRVFNFAMEKNNIEIIEELLNQEDLDLSEDNNYAIKRANYYGLSDIVENILQDKNVFAKIKSNKEDYRDNHPKIFQEFKKKNSQNNLSMF